MKIQLRKEPENKLPPEIKLPSSNFLIEALRNISNRLLTNVDVTFNGVENLRNITSPIIFAVAPHNGHMDSLFARRAIGSASKQARNKAIFIAAGDGYWDKQPRKTLGTLAVRTVTISRKGGEETKRNKKQIENIIRQGNHLVLFPEGTRSRIPSKKVIEREFKTGAAQWAIATRDLDTVIVPIYMNGAAQIMPPGRATPKFRSKRGEKKFSVSLTIGTPIHVASQIPNNFESLSVKEQYIIIKQITALIHAFMVAQEEFAIRGKKQLLEY